MGKVICTGLGPGDPDLMSVRSHRLISNARPDRPFPQGRPSRSGPPHCRGDAGRPVSPNTRWNTRSRPSWHFDSPEYDTALSQFYDHWAARLLDLSQTDEVIVLCEGDPFFYGSFMHLYNRLHGVVDVEVVPGHHRHVGLLDGDWSAHHLGR